MPVQVTLRAPALEGLAARFERQIPFAMSLGMNNALKAAQGAERQHIRQTFIVRRPTWVLESVKITKFSTKRDLTAVLQIDPTRNVLGKFEVGGTKVSRRPGGAVVIPEEARATLQAVVPVGLRPRAFQFQRAGVKAGVTVFRGLQNTVLLQRPGKRGVILQRVAGGSGQRQTRRLLFILVPAARIRPTLRFREIVRRVFLERWPAFYQAALSQAIRTA